MTVTDEPVAFRRRLVDEISARGAEAAEPLSAEQRRLWLLGALSSGFNPVALRGYALDGGVDPAEVQMRLSTQVSRHPALRSVFDEVDERPVRFVLPFADVSLRVVRDASVHDDHVRQLSRTPFSLTTGPLLRAVMVLPEPAGPPARLILAGHRFVLDERSLDLVAATLIGDTADRGAGRLSEVLARERKRMREPGVTESVVIWGERLARPAATELATPTARPAVKGQASSCLLLPVSADVRLTAVPEGVSSTAVAAWLTVLMRQRGSDAGLCLVDAPVDAADHDVVGPLTSSVPVRCEAGDQPISVLRERVAVALNEVPPASFARLLEVCPPPRDVSRPPVAQTAVRWIDARAPLAAVAGRAVFVRPLPAGTTECDLALTVWLLPEGMTLQAEYDPEVLDEATVRAALTQWLAAIRAFTGPGAADTSVGGVVLLDETEHRRVQRSGLGDRANLPAGGLADLVVQQVGRTPDATALICGDSQLTYRMLWDRSRRLAGALRARGIGPGRRVALMLPRGPEVIVAQLATLAVGAAFVPIDPAHPRGRVEFLLRDAGVELLISAAPDARTLPVPVLRPDDGVADGAPELPVLVAGDDPAYLIYTSGSTGQPKAVAVPHRALVNNLFWRQRQWQLDGCDRVLHNHPFTFDPSLWATFWPMMFGATIVLADEAMLGDPDALVTLIRDRGVTILGGVPSLLGLLVDARHAGECTAVRLVLSGAEPFTDQLLRRIEARWSTRVANLYGPTETTIDALMYQLPEPGGNLPLPVPIGRPLTNADVHVVDENLRLVPDGVLGEIVVAGEGVALGYAGQPGLTAQRFVPNPFGDTRASRLYRTGDLGRRFADGWIRFAGRTDSQVKVRGHRIELAEVQTALQSVAGVREAAVFVLDAGGERARLMASVGVGDDALTADEVRRLLGHALPAYLVPDIVEVVGELPRGINGKLDLATIEEGLAGRATLPEITAVARTPLERTVAAAFAEVLGVKVGVDADFFEAGGTSLLLARLSGLLSRRLDVSIPLHEFFLVPTVAGVNQTVELYRRQGLEGVLQRQHSATLEADAVLADTIVPDGLPHADWARPQSVLLTGATGYLGLHLLEQLLLRTGATVVCLCRGEDSTQALARIRAGLDEYGIQLTAAHLDRVRCVVGDLGLPGLGLPTEIWDELAATVDVIYHNGALVNFVYPYSALRGPNVGGTQEVLRMACDTRLKAVHHVSTIDTLLATHMPRPFIEDDSPLRSAVGVPAGYTGSKWVAEKVVDIARRRGIPVTVFRPGLILGHTRTGATQTIDYLLVALRGFLPMRILPDYPRIFDTVPVDYVASAIVHISLQPAALDGFYHLFNPAPVPLSRFCDWIREYGYDFSLVPFEEGRRRALEVGADHPLYPLVPLIRDAEAEPHRALDPRHIDELRPAEECARTLEHLAGSGIVCPPMSREGAHAVLRHLQSVGFLPSPQEKSSAGAGEDVSA